jgi:hypothetical protein
MVCPFCGCDHFYARQLCYHDIIVDNDCNFISDEGIYDSEKPYGDFECTDCGAEFSDLEPTAIVCMPVAAESKKEFKDKVFELADIMYRNHDTGTPAQHLDMALYLFNKHEGTDRALDTQTFNEIISKMEGRDNY